MGLPSYFITQLCYTKIFAIENLSLACQPTRPKNVQIHTLCHVAELSEGKSIFLYFYAEQILLHKDFSNLPGKQLCYGSGPWAETCLCCIFAQLTFMITLKSITTLFT